MLDIKLFRETPDIVRNNLIKRGKEELLKDVDKIIKLDNEIRKKITKLNELRHEKNKITKEIGKTKDKRLIKKVKEINEEIEKLEGKIKKKSEKLNTLMLLMPNILHDSVPKGKDDSENVTVRTFGEKPKFNFKPRNHMELCELNDWYDVKRAAKTSGARFYYLKNELVELELALFRYGIDYLRRRGFTVMDTPYMTRERFFYGTGYLPFERDALYKIEGEDLYLIGTAEVALAGYHADETLLESELPKKYGGISPCFRTEAGSHGKDTKGIFRVHQFNKIEMFIYSKPEDSWKLHEELIKTAEKFWQSLGIPYRVVNICTGDIGNVASKKYDIEAWLPGQNKYREVVSCSNVTDFQARRLNIKYREEEGKPPKGYVHMLNSTLVTNARGIIAIIENYQTKDGRVVVPKVLRKYIGKDIL